METSQMKSFEQRWRQARKQPQKIQARVKPRHVEISMITILERYERLLRKAEAEHRLDPELCQTACEEAERMKQTVRRIDESKLQGLKP